MFFAENILRLCSNNPLKTIPLFAHVFVRENVYLLVREVIENITPAILRNTQCEVEYRLQTLRAISRVHYIWFILLDYCL